MWHADFDDRLHINIATNCLLNWKIDIIFFWRKCFCNPSQAPLKFCLAESMVIKMGKHPGQLKDQVASPGGTTMKEFMSLKRVHLCPTVQAWWFSLLLLQNVAMGWTSDFNFLKVQLIMLLVNLITSTIKNCFFIFIVGQSCCLPCSYMSPRVEILPSLELPFSPLL